MAINIPTYAGQLDLSSLGSGISIMGDWYYPPTRGIQTTDTTGTQMLTAQVVVSEDASDDLQITAFPVENGAVINDHAFKNPAELSVQMGWSSAYCDQEGIGDIRSIYEQILNLQAARTPFTVYTGKRVYLSMLIASLRTHTDETLEFSFMADIQFREVITVNTDVNTTGTSNLTNQQGLADPATNAQTANGGQNSTVPVSIPISSPLGQALGLMRGEFLIS